MSEEKKTKKPETGEKAYKGMHNGTVVGKGFEKSRRNRKTHAQRRAQHAAQAKR